MKNNMHNLTKKIQDIRLTWVDYYNNLKQIKTNYKNLIFNQLNVKG
jgi:hypothetical protein